MKTSQLIQRNVHAGKCATCGNDVPARKGWRNASLDDEDRVHCSEHEEEARRDAIWDFAFRLCCGLGHEVDVVGFFRPAWAEFDRLLGEGKVTESDRDLFMESWGQHNWLFISANRDLMEVDPEETTSAE